MPLKKLARLLGKSLNPNHRKELVKKQFLSLARRQNIGRKGK